MRTKAEIKEYKRQYHVKNRDGIIKKVDEWVKNNPERRRETARKWAAKNRTENSKKIRAYQSEWRKKKRATDKRFCLANNMRTAIWETIKKVKNRKQWQKLVGYTVDDLMAHLEKLFQPGMTWENYGEWHIDHKIPVTAFNFTDPKHIDFTRCWALKNLQPMWAKENNKKYNKLDKPFQPSLAL